MRRLRCSRMIVLLALALGACDGGSKALGIATSKDAAVPSAGGTLTSGGAIASGGAVKTGGVSASGGSVGSGGAFSAGGIGPTGGAVGSGGLVATGGSRLDANVVGDAASPDTTRPLTGGATATGGSTSNGGTSDCTTPPAPSELIGWATKSGGTVGGGTATPVTVSTLAELNNNAGGTAAKVIYLSGSGTFSGTVTIGSNKTIAGICGATIKGHIHMSGSANVILRNLKIVGNNCTDSPSDCSAGADAITVVSGAHNLWFDHLDISDGSDGNLDITLASDFVTISYTKFWYSTQRSDPGGASGGHRFSNLIGAADNTPGDVGKLNVTIHHSWWAPYAYERMPRVRYGKVHLFNNLYTVGSVLYSVALGVDASILSENNVFQGVSKAYDTTGYSNAASAIKTTGDVGASPITIGTAFTPSYAYTLDATTNLAATIQAQAGPK